MAVGKLRSGAALALLFMAVSTSAHHSTAMFDQTRKVMLSGTIREFQWTNPHCWIQIEAAAADGQPAREWSIELGSPNTISRGGWKRTTLVPGQKVNMIVNPMRDGSPGAALVSVTTSEGKVLGPQGRPVPAADAAPRP
ncbi:DUF6152 family protein [Croceibacterium aestuarii]|uniref:DUF6152 family protein n=1 Tax=Croceibacterium aestuarii TaxID=3064139 RepID=UPI00272E0055|nr:DUF6152 family protein [Croceibacterium sp. D39]